LRRLRALLFGAALSLGIALGFYAPVSATNQTPTQSYCMAWAALHNVLIASWTNPLYLGIGCGLQPGDQYTDGPLYNPVPSTISGLTWTIPANTFIANGQRVVTQALATSAPNNTTSYFWLDCNGCSGSTYGTWESTTTSSPPHSYSSLQYTLFTSSGSIAQLTPTMNSAVFGSGFLNLTGNFDGAIYSGAITSGNRMLFQDSGQPAIVMGGAPIFRFQSTASECVDGALVQYQLTQFINDSNTSPVIIGCSTDTGDVLAPALLVTGRAVFNAIIDSNLSSSTVPICGSTTAIEAACSNGALLAAIATSPMPLATATPLVTTNSGTLGVGAAGWIFNDSGTGCSGGSAYILNLEAASTSVAKVSCEGDYLAAGFISAGNANAATLSAGDLGASRSTTTGALFLGGSSSSCRLDFGVTTGAVATFGCAVTVGNFIASNIKDTGLGAAASKPLCGGNTANILQCSAQSVMFATTGNTSAATGTTANTYVQLGSNVAITTGTSLGTNGNWLVTVTMDTAIATGLASENVYSCITSASTFTLQDGTTNGASNCVTAKTNSFAGAPAYGEQSAAGLAQYGLNQKIIATVTVANSTTFTASCFVAGSTITSVTVSGYCHASAVPF